MVIFLSYKSKKTTEEDSSNNVEVNAQINVIFTDISSWSSQNGFKYREDRDNALLQPTVPRIEIFDFNRFLEIPAEDRSRVGGLSFNSEILLNADYSLFPSLLDLSIANSNQIRLDGISKTKVHEIDISRFSDTFFVSVVDISELSLCKELKILSIECDEIMSIEVVSDCENLEALSIYSKTPFSIPKDLSKLTKLHKLAIGYDDMTDYLGIDTIPSTFQFTISSLESIRNASLEALGIANLSSMVVHVTIYNAEKTKIDKVVAQQKERNPEFQLVLEDY